MVAVAAAMAGGGERGGGGRGGVGGRGRRPPAPIDISQLFGGPLLPIVFSTFGGPTFTHCFFSTF